MKAIYDFLLYVHSTMPPWVVAVFLGWGMSISVTQPIKFLLPLRMDPKVRANIARICAFCTGCVAVVYYMPGVTGWLVGFMVGVWSPTAYWLLMLVVGHRFPWLKDFLSGDVRGKEENRL
jgi:hypothetical protein